MAKGLVIAPGVFFLVIAIVGYVIPVNDQGWTIPDVNEMCSSSLGLIGKVFSGDIQQVCTTYKNLLLGIYGSGLLGIVLIVIGSIIPSKSKDKSMICSYCNFVAMSDAELLKHKSDNHLDKSPFKCEHCDFIGISEEILWNHYNDNHPDKKKWKWN